MKRIKFFEAKKEGYCKKQKNPVVGKLNYFNYGRF